MAILLVSGAVWLAVHYLWGAAADQLPHPLEAWMVRLHSVAGFAGIFVAGILGGCPYPAGLAYDYAHPSLA